MDRKRENVAKTEKWKTENRDGQKEGKNRVTELGTEREEESSRSGKLDLFSIIPNEHINFLA